VSKLGLYVRTIRYLRVSQLWYRLWLMLLHRLPDTTPGLDTYRVCVRPSFVRYPFRKPTTSMYLGGWVFCFLNETLYIGGEWELTTPSRLWRFNLHYFGFLLAMASSEDQVRLILDWIWRVKLGSPDAWHPYVISLRICNWIVTISECWSRISIDNQGYITRSLAQQLDYLNHHLEFDVLGNHLLENCKALIVGGVFLNQPEYWRKGYAILMSQLSEQILSDGGHYERSPAYHFIVLESVGMAYQALLEVMSTEELVSLERVLTRMCEFGVTMLWDGAFPLWNDSAFGIVADPEQVIRDISVLIGIPVPVAMTGVTIHEATGYVVYRSEPWSWCLDVGPGGPDFLMGHAHNDCLSFTLRVQEQDLVTDSGVYEYAAGEWRDYFRSTAAHNTVRVNGVEQSEIWSSFRVGRRAHIEAFFYKESESIVGAWHTGYAHMGVHVGRSIYFGRTNEIQVMDMFRSECEIELESYIHFAPGVLIIQDTPERYFLEFGQGRAVLMIDPRWSCVVKESWYSPQFGKKEQRLSVTLRGSVPAGITQLGYTIGSC
jgi:uncharacterized heparinase superfamily protein